MLPIITNRMHRNSGNLFISILIVVFFLASISLISTAQAQNKCDEELTQAEQKYNSGRFDEAIQMIGNCLEKPGITEEEKKRAYRLLGLTYIAKDYLEEAKTAVRRLLDLIPNYQADTVQDPPSFANLVEEVRDEMEAAQVPEKTQKVPAMQRARSPRSSQAKPIWFGFRGGLNMANITEDIGDYGDKQMRLTFGFGGIVEFCVSPMFAIQTNALYNQKGVKFEVVEQGIPVTVTFKLNYFSFPILGKLAFGEGSAAKPFIIFGPEIGFLSSATVSGEALGINIDLDLKDDLGIETESVEFSIDFGAGVNIPLGNIIGFLEGRYGLGLTKWNKEGPDVKNNVIYVNTGLLF